MASFFKRAVTAALERREEVQDQNIVLQEKAVEENLDRLKKVEELRLKRNKALKEYKKYMPMLQSAALNANSDISSVPEPLALNLLKQAGGDPTVAITAITKMAKTSPDTFKQVSSDAQKAQGDMTSATQASSNMLPSQQKSMQLADQTEQLVREGDVNYGKIGSTVATSLLNVLTGQPMRSTREITRERFGSLFPNDEQAQEAYEFATEVLSEGMPDTIPAMKDPEKMRKVFQFAKIAKGQDKFDNELEVNLSRRMSPILSILKTRIGQGDNISTQLSQFAASLPKASNPVALTEKFMQNNKGKLNAQTIAALKLVGTYSNTLKDIAYKKWNNAEDGVYNAISALNAAEKSEELVKIKEQIENINPPKTAGDNTNKLNEAKQASSASADDFVKKLGVETWNDLKDLSDRRDPTPRGGYNVMYKGTIFTIEKDGKEYKIRYSKANNQFEFVSEKGRK
tara:strand:- start:1098 stop:2468 length:1371 start_codon:yes stop_codon:yes gene_type:complete